MTAHERRDTVRQFGIAAGLSLFAAVAFYFSTNATLRDLDYTSQIASALLSGHLGLREKPPFWLNEMIPHRDSYYSAFPLGAVLSMVPIALLEKAGLIHHFPGHVLAAVIAGAGGYVFFQLAKAFGADYFGLEGSALVRRRVANRSRPCFAGTNCSSVFYPGATVPFRRGSVLRARFW